MKEKEMNYEEKYKEALAKARAYFENESYTEMADVFPELKESEGERAKRMLDTITYKMSQHQPDIFTEEENEWFNSWLERQKELDKMIVVSPEVWGNAMSDAFEFGKKEGEKQKEQKHTKGNKLFDQCVDNCDPATRKEVNDKIDEMLKEQKPAVTHGETYQVDTLGTQQVIAGKMPQKPAEWSEEDETYLQDALWCVKQAEKSCKDEDDKGACWSAERWLKSLRSRPKLSDNWKPSEEQMKELYHAASIAPIIKEDGNYLYDLYDDLKKRM